MSDILDTRELQEELENLEAEEGDLLQLKDELQVLQEQLEEYERSGSFSEDSDEHRRIMEEIAKTEEEIDDFDFEEDALNELRELKEEVGGEWDYGVQLIPESDFEEYSQELCEDIGDIPKNLPSYIVIDWAATADNLKADYSTVTFRGEDYLYRA